MTYLGYKIFLKFKIIVESNDLGLFRIGTDRLLRLKLIKKLKNEGHNSKEVSEFLNISGIKPLRTDNPYTPKLVWVTLKKYQNRLDRIGNNRVTQFKEGLYISLRGMQVFILMVLIGQVAINIQTQLLLLIFLIKKSCGIFKKFHMMFGT